MHKKSLIVAVSNEGRMLVFDLENVPRLSRGKGNKIINIPNSRLQKGEEWVVDYAIISEGSSLVVSSGKRYLSLKPNDLQNYIGERGRRGHKLPRGFQRVDALSAE
jgi:topoisomerase-4 subunit A